MLISMKDDDNNTGWLGFSLSPHMKMEANTSCYNVVENGDFLSPLSALPLKSDGSLCITEAHSGSHSQGSSPKLEDFLGVATMASTHDYGTHQPAFYDQEPFRQHYYSGLNTDHIQPTSEVEELFPCLKTWIDHRDRELEQPVNTTTMVEDSTAMGCRGELQSLSLSMSPGSQSSCVTASRQISSHTNTSDCVPMEPKKRGSQKQIVHRKSIDTFGQRTSQYRGVTRHRWTGRYEAHLWDNTCKKEGQTRKGRQVYLGGYDMEEKAARAYDLAALKYWGPSTYINFPLETYHQELQTMKNMSRQEYVAHLRRRSSGFSRGASIYRGVTRHHQHGRWQARIGRVAGNKDLYLGTFSTQEEAGEAYDVAAIKFRGVNAVTNFDISRYDVDKIMSSSTLLTAEIARRKNEKEPIEIITSQNNEVFDQGNNCQNPSNCLIIKASSQTVMEQFSNPSSLVTSLSSSREASPERNGAHMHFAKTNSLETNVMNSSSWVPFGTGHLPVFASWNDM